MTLYTLENDCWQVGILPDTGASIASGASMLAVNGSTCCARLPSVISTT